MAFNTGNGTQHSPTECGPITFSALTPELQQKMLDLLEHSNDLSADAMSQAKAAEDEDRKRRDAFEKQQDRKQLALEERQERSVKATEELVAQIKRIADHLLSVNDNV